MRVNESWNKLSDISRRTREMMTIINDAIIYFLLNNLIKKYKIFYKYFSHFKFYLFFNLINFNYINENNYNYLFCVHEWLRTEILPEFAVSSVLDFVKFCPGLPKLHVYWRYTGDL